MRIAIVTKTISPGKCGISDHTLMLYHSLLNHDCYVNILAGHGEKGEDRKIISNGWNKEGFSILLEDLRALNVDYIILQYTPLSFEVHRGKQNHDLKDFWENCSKYWQTSLIIHETYFQVWYYHPSWWRGPQQKRMLQQLSQSSHNVFTASELLVNELNSWGLDHKTNRLSLGSHFPVHNIDRIKERDRIGISSGEVVLTLFGGGQALKLMSQLVNQLDTFLSKNNISFCWCLLGGIPQDWFSLSAPVLSPGRMSELEISKLLQISDIFLVPHQCGLTAKRSALMAGMQHGMPVVGTKGYMTDLFWDGVPGVTLVPVSQKSKFNEEVLELCNNQHLRNLHGKQNQIYYENNCTWEKIANTLINQFSQ